jgi:threonine/homoserine/homoserine lactone efflux protein
LGRVIWHPGGVTVTSALASFALVAGLLTIVPGLDTALVLRSALTQSRAHAFATAIGIGTGSLVWGVAAAIGVSALLTASQLAFTGLRLAGAGYMLWLGGTMIWNSRRAAPAVGTPDTGTPAAGTLDAELPDAAPATSIVAAWRRGLLTNLLNPKVGVFYIAMIPQFLPAGTSHLLMGVLLALVHDVEGMVWFSLLILLTGVARRGLSGPWARRITDRATGAVLIAFGAKLAASG